MQLYSSGKRRVALSLHSLRTRLLGCKGSQETPRLERRSALFEIVPDSPRTRDVEGKGPCFVNHPAKNNSL